jgi:hypothetical protein
MTLRAKGAWEGAEDFGFMWYVYTSRYIQCKLEKNASASKHIAPVSIPPKFPAPAGQPALSARQLLEFFLHLLPRRELWKLPSLKTKRFYERLFTPIVTLWYLIFQRLASDHTLEAVVADAQAGGADSLRKSLSKKLLSTATVSFSNARQRLPLAFLTEALALQAGKILGLNPKARWRGLLVSLLDGSTVRMRPCGDIPKRFPPHPNQAKIPAYWCLMRVVVCFCVHTGAALNCALGNTSLSEQVLACQIILCRALSPCLFIGDRNFGVFRIVQAARSAGAQVLLRMTRSRARKLLGRSLCLGQYPVGWSPTRHDQLQPGCSKDPVHGQLLVVRIKRKGFRTQTLYLFTTLPKSAHYPVEELVHLYGLRWHIELNLRYLKAQMRLVQLECKSADMAQKEWLAGLMAYNLIRAAMLCAAVQGGICALALSFSSSRRHLIHWLTQFGRSRRNCEQRWEKMLRLLSRARLPQRRKCRPAEPRAQRHIRQPYPPLVGSRREARQQLKKCAQKS